MSKDRRERKKLRGFLFAVLCMALLFAGTVMVQAATVDSTGITVRFLDSNGNSIPGYEDQIVYPGGSITLPQAPASKQVGTGSPSWKPAKTATADMYYFDSEQKMSYSAIKDWTEEYGEDNVLTLYGTKMCTLRYYDNSGATYIGLFRAYEGTEVSLRKSPNSKNELYKGWSRYKNGTGVWGKFGGSYTVTTDMNLYLVEYVKVTFKNSDGSTNSTYSGLTKIMKRGSSFSLPSVPSKTNYRSLGWATSKNVSSADYTSQQTITVTKSMTLYAVRQYLPYAVTFNNNTGTSQSSDFKNLYVRAAANEVITLPEVPAQSGYVALGWATKTKATTAQYKAGAKVRINQKTKFYAVYRTAKNCTVTFCLGDGTIPTNYASLKSSVKETTTITLPSVPTRSGYLNVGWSLTLNGKTTTYKAGAKVKINGNYKFYAVQKQAVSIVLHANDGTVLSTKTVEKGSSYTLPSAENTSEYTFMGWSTKANVVISEQSSQKPQYEAGVTLSSINSTVHLYQVIFKRSSEKSLTSGQMAKPDLQKYSKVVFVGDSRTVRMNQTLRTQNCTANLEGVKFVASSSQGLSWFKSTGYNTLLNEVYSANADAAHPVAVVFNLGINDLSNVSEYVTYMNQIAEELKNLNCKLFYMSLNPINSTMIDKKGLMHREEAAVRNFNLTIRSGLAANYTYIDTYSWLMKTGFGTDSGLNGQNTGIDDGLHYTVNTYKRIYDLCISTVNAS